MFEGARELEPYDGKTRNLRVWVPCTSDVSCLFTSQPHTDSFLHDRKDFHRQTDNAKKSLVRCWVRSFLIWKWGQWQQLVLESLWRGGWAHTWGATSGTYKWTPLWVSLLGPSGGRGGGQGGCLPGSRMKLEAAVVCLWYSSSALAFPGSLPTSTALSGLLALKIITYYKNSFFLHLCALMF